MALLFRFIKIDNILENLTFRLKDTYFLIYFYETIFDEKFFYEKTFYEIKFYDNLFYEKFFYEKFDSTKIFILWNERYPKKDIISGI